MAKRRSVMAGLGALATGSGAVFASGAFDSATTTPGANLQVISDGQVAVRGSAHANDVYDLDGEDDSADAINFDDFDRDTDFPRATFFDAPDENESGELEEDHGGNFNGDIDLTVAIELREDDTFDSLLKIDNNSEVDQEVLINYQEDSENEDGLYGEDVGDGNNEVSKSTVQEIYQFKIAGEGTLISPDPDTSTIANTGSEIAIEDENTGANWVKVGAGNTIEVTLNYDTTGSGVTGDINSAARSGDNRFGEGSGSAVDLLDGIVVAARDEPEEEQE